MKIMMFWSHAARPSHFDWHFRSGKETVMERVQVLWIGPGHRIATCVSVHVTWLEAYRRRVVNEWRGCVLGVYRPKPGHH